MRDVIRSGIKIDIVYRDEASRETQRRIWPFALGYLGNLRIIAAWCELRNGFRHFRVDRIADLTITGQTYPRRAEVLLAEWRKENGIVPDL